MGCYASLMEDAMMERYFVWGELRADMVSPTAIASEHYLALNNGEIVSSNPYTYWGDFYRTINQCNTLLELGKKAMELDISFSETLLKQYEAEAIAIRSLAYFYLVRTFRDVPYITQASIYDDQVFSVPVSKQADIIDSLIVSLRKVEADVPYSHNTLASNKGRFNVFSVKALLADIYLWKGDYDNVIDLTTQIMESGQYSLVPVGREEAIVEGQAVGTFEKVYYVNEADVASYFNSMYATGNSVESIFELQFGADKNNPFCGMFLPDNAKLRVKAENFNTEFFPSSGIDRGWFDMRGEGVSYKQGYVWKWIGLSKMNISCAHSTRHTAIGFLPFSRYNPNESRSTDQKAIQNGNDQQMLEQADKLLRQVRNES